MAPRTLLTPAAGLEITGLRGGQLVDEAIAAECRQGIDEHGVVVYRDAHLTDDQLVAFSRLLGDVMILPRGTETDHPEISKVTRDPSKSSLANYREGTFFWHIDGTTDDIPAKATLLTARAVDDEGGGDTEFASTYSAYDALSPDHKAELQDLRVVHSFTAAQLLVHPDPSPKELAIWERVPKREHPLVWKRRNGRASLLIGATAERVVGLSDEESRALLTRLLDWTTQPQLVVHHQWRQGDLVVWDNTGVLHRALPYNSGSPRLMHRTTLVGDEQVA